MTDPRACWAPAPLRPVVPLALVREFVYEYAAVSPQDGALDFMTAEKMNTENMNRFLDQVRNAHPDEFLIMILDGASSHKAKGLNIPEKMRLIHLPPYSPELNPAERLWNILRRDYFANRVFDSLKSAIDQAETGLAKMAANRSAIRSLTNWPWISDILNAIYNYCESSGLSECLPRVESLNVIEHALQLTVVSVPAPESGSDCRYRPRRQPSA